MQHIPAKVAVGLLNVRGDHRPEWVFELKLLVQETNWAMVLWKVNTLPHLVSPIAPKLELLAPSYPPVTFKNLGVNKINNAQFLE